MVTLKASNFQVENWQRETESGDGWKIVEVFFCTPVPSYPSRASLSIMDLSKMNFDDQSSTGTFGVSSSLTQNDGLDMQITPGTPKIRNSDLGPENYNMIFSEMFTSWEKPLKHNPQVLAWVAFNPQVSRRIARLQSRLGSWFFVYKKDQVWWMCGPWSLTASSAHGKGTKKIQKEAVDRLR